ncbi:MAG: hypothetical protein IJM04_10930 [Prevotella sp.]|nr:hypothetical protein [Prevotella sp.]
MSQIMCFCVWHNMRIVEKLPRHSDTRDGAFSTSSSHGLSVGGRLSRRRRGRHG